MDDDRIFGQDGNDTLLGGEGNDYLDGGLGNDVIYGQDGNDSISGAFGNDRLFGGAGADTIFAGWGNDAIYGDGGTGADVFIFAANEGLDVISDFSMTQGDGLTFGARRPRPPILSGRLGRSLGRMLCSPLARTVW
jgi:Ca2+-binding RTX toxin-like protein